mmetsp:Transcript_4458/g.20241  ORF Transcript_4458/g.20241 Transcript_4458/m.20241 type:complete len:704 (-) Transcript_4458:918-3029(-)
MATVHSTLARNPARAASSRQKNPGGGPTPTAWVRCAPALRITRDSRRETRRARVACAFGRRPTANVSWEDGKTQPPGAIDGIGPDKFVEFFRQASPYIVNHHGSVMVVVIPGEVFIAKDVLQGIVQDVALLQSLGVRVVLVLGSNKQVEEGLVDRGIGSEVVDGYRVTSPEALEVAMEAAGRNSVLVQALLSRGINVAVTRRHGDRAAGNSMNGGLDSGMNPGAFQGAMGGGMNAGGTNSMNEFNGIRSGSNFGGYDSRTSVGSPTGVSGNFIQAKRRGVVKGLDFQYTGDVVSVDVNAVRMRLAMGDVVLLSSLGFNAAGEVLNCQAYDVAVSVAIDIGADKLVSYLSPGDMPRNESGERMKYMPLSVAEDYIMDVARRGLELSPGQSSGQSSGESSADADSADDAAAWSAETMEAVGGSAEALPLPPPAGERDADGWMLDSWRWLQDGMGTDGGLHGLHDPNRLGSSPWQRLTERGLQWRVEGCPQEVCAAVFSCKAGVRRAHLVDYTVPGALLLELYTYDGVGAMVSRDQYEGTRPAKPGDWIHIKNILEPLAKEGTTVVMSDEALIKEVSGGNFSVMERDGKVIACAALRRYECRPGTSEGAEGAECEETWPVAEVAAFAVRPGYRNEGRGDQLLQYLESRARSAGIEKLFLLTTRTADWFVERGFIHAGAAIDSPLLPPGKQAQEGRNSQLYIRTLKD